MNLSNREIIGIVVIAVLVGLLIWMASKANKSVVKSVTMGDVERDCYALPKDPEPTVFGPKYWAAFHDLTHRIPCNSCREFAEKFMVFFHDMVNAKIGKGLYNKKNFDEMSEIVMRVKMNNNTWPNT